MGKCMSNCYIRGIQVPRNPHVSGAHPARVLCQSS